MTKLFYELYIARIKYLKNDFILVIKGLNKR